MGEGDDVGAGLTLGADGEDVRLPHPAVSEQLLECVDGAAGRHHVVEDRDHLVLQGGGEAASSAPR